jgi:metal-sulfur cluster biosynthetic enzyme
MHKKSQESTLIAQVIAVLKTIYDPEIPSVSVWDLGLIYGVLPKKNLESTEVKIIMSFTSINCPIADSLPLEIEKKVLANVTQLSACQVEVVWEPKWDSSLINEEAKLELGI